MTIEDGRRPTREEIGAAAAALCSGGVVAFPTETVYGLGAHALDPAAVARLYALKGRPATSPLIVHVASTEAARALAETWPAAAERLAEAYWPGPLTIIVHKVAVVPDAVTAGLPTVGLRVPSHPVAQALLAAAGVPVAAPSANRFTELSATRAGHVRAAFPDGLDAVLDAGRTPIGIESAVVSLAGDAPCLLRHGAIGIDRLRAVLPSLELPSARPAAGAHASPGQHARHYSPRTPLVVLAPSAAPPAGDGARVRRAGHGTPGPRDRELPADPAGFAAQLYDTLHELDAGELEWIAVDAPPAGPGWEAIRDRLRRAAAR